MRRAPREPVDAPVLCIGNFTVGGTGKTPTAIAVAKFVTALGLTPGILSRGHGGTSGGPRLVDPAHDSARHVGDEPLLLAEHALVAVTPDRAEGARLLVERGCDFLIMDDGFQSARIQIDYALAIVDARYGIGNGHVIPGGPLRAPLAEQLHHATALLKMGEGRAADTVVRMASRAGKPVFEASVRTRDADQLSGGRFLAFAGIGHPERFFDAIAAAGGDVKIRRSFGDHHVFQKEELIDMETAAHKGGLDLLTTAKDAARLRHADVPPLFRAKLRVLEVETQFDEPEALERIVGQTITAWKARRLRH